MKKFIILLIAVMAVIVLSSTAFADNKFFWRNSLTALAAIHHTNEPLTSGDGAIVVVKDGASSLGYLYVYDADSPNTTSSPERIAPTSGGGAWNLVNFYAQVFTGTAADGESYIDVSNSGAFSGTATEGYCYHRNDTDSWCCYSGTVWKCVVLVAP